MEKVLLLGKVNLERSCHGHQHRVNVGTGPQGEQGLTPGVLSSHRRWQHHDAIL